MSARAGLPPAPHPQSCDPDGGPRPPRVTQEMSKQGGVRRDRRVRRFYPGALLGECHPYDVTHP